MTLRLLTRDGDKTLFIRGLNTPGGQVGIAAARLTTPGGSITIFDQTVANSGGLTVTADPIFVSGAGASASPQTVGTSASTAIPSGGVPPYSYLWSGPAGWGIISPTEATAAFTYPSLPPGSVLDNTFTCTVTDARGATGTVSVQAEVSNFGRF